MSRVETQPERTALAWQRTGLGLLAVAGLIALRAVTHGAAPLLLLAGATALMGLALLGWLAPARARRTQRALAEGGPVSALWEIRLVTVAVALICLAATAAIAFLPAR